MKLRLHGSTLRLRLGEADVARFRDTGRVERAIAFGAEPGASLVYVLESSADAQHVGATFADGRITVRIPQPLAHEWATGDDVSLAAEQPLGDGVPALRILIEKDLPCEPGHGQR